MLNYLSTYNKTIKDKNEYIVLVLNKNVPSKLISQNQLEIPLDSSTALHQSILSDTLIIQYIYSVSTSDIV